MKIIFDSSFIIEKPIFLIFCIVILLIMVFTVFIVKKEIGKKN